MSLHHNHDSLSTWIRRLVHNRVGSKPRGLTYLEALFSCGEVDETGPATPLHKLHWRRAQRVINALQIGELTRESLDRVAGCSNGPALIKTMRSHGLELPCRAEISHDRDGVKSWRGVYFLSALDRQYISRARASQHCEGSFQ